VKLGDVEDEELSQGLKMSFYIVLCYFIQKKKPKKGIFQSYGTTPALKEKYIEFLHEEYHQLLVRFTPKNFCCFLI
jgi:hypothetical protein